MESIIREVANRIRETRLICEISEEEMAACTGVTPEHYRELESGEADFSFTKVAANNIHNPRLNTSLL